MTTSPITITAEMLDDLQRKAKAAGCERWICIDGDGFDVDHRLITTEARLAAPTVQIATVHYGHPDAGMLEPFQSDQVAAGDHIAAASPAVVDALVEHIRSLTERMEKEGEWISVEERLPERGFWLVSVDTDDGPETHVLQLNGKGQWIYEGEPTFCQGCYFRPTHWKPRPLPAIAQEGAENE